MHSMTHSLSESVKLYSLFLRFRLEYFFQITTIKISTITRRMPALTTTIAIPSTERGGFITAQTRDTVERWRGRESINQFSLKHHKVPPCHDFFDPWHISLHTHTVISHTCDHACITSNGKLGLGTQCNTDVTCIHGLFLFIPP